MEDVNTSGRNISELRREVRPIEDVATSGRNFSELRRRREVMTDDPTTVGRNVNKRDDNMKRRHTTRRQWGATMV